MRLCERERAWLDGRPVGVQKHITIYETLKRIGDAEQRRWTPGASPSPQVGGIFGVQAAISSTCKPKLNGTLQGVMHGRGPAHQGGISTLPDWLVQLF